MCAQAKPVTAWATPAPIVYGTPLDVVFNATANVAGDFTYEPSFGTILNAGTGQAVRAFFTPRDLRNYEVATLTVLIDVRQAPQTIAWPLPAAIVYGTALSPVQLNARIEVPGPSPAGAPTYTPPAGTILQAGLAQVLSVSVAGTANYTPASASVTIDVLKATPVITWAQPAPIIYGARLGSDQLNATANVAGTFQYTPPSVTLLEAGMQTLSARFTPADARNYEEAEASVTLEVQRATPVITWTRRAPIVYGTPLGASQLNASTDVSGAFDYRPPSGTILDAGNGQTLSVLFTPDDTHNYNSAGASTTIDVAKAKQTIVWPAPAPIVYGTALSATQLNARSDVVGPSPAGQLTYIPVAGTVLDAGTHKLSVTAAETPNYESASASVSLDVRRAPLSLVADAKSKLYGAPLPSLTGVLTGVVNNDPITPSYATSATQQSPAGVYPITATLIDANNRLPNYDVTITASTLSVHPAPLLISANDASKQYSDPLPELTATFTGFVLGETRAVLGGTLSIQTTALARSAPGMYPIAIGGLTSANYAITFAGGTLTVTPEDARVAIISPRLVTARTGGATSVTLAATVSDISATADAAGDTEAGDIRKATLTFVDRETDAILCVAPIGLPRPDDERIGVATCTFTRDFGTALPATLVAGARVGGYYTRDAATDDATLSIVTPTSDFITGAGAIELAPETGTSPRVELNLQNDKNGTVKGKFVFTYTRTEAGVIHQYELTAGSVDSLSIRRTPTGGVASIIGKAALRDVTSKSEPVVIVEDARLIVSATDGGEPPGSDGVSITLFDARGGLWLAAGWNGTQPVEQILRDGNLAVHYGK